MLQCRYAHLYRETNLREAVNFTTSNLSLRQWQKTLRVIRQAAGCICWWAPLPYMTDSHHPSAPTVREFRNYRNHNTHTHNRFMALFPGPTGWASARRELLDFTMQGKTNRGRHTDHPAGRHSIRTNQCLPPTSPNFSYRPDALPAAQPTVSKHQRQIAY